MGLRSVVRGAAAVTTGALIISFGTGTGPTAFADDPDPGVAQVLAFLGDPGGPGTLSAWTSTLSTVGRLGEKLPLVDASPGALLGLDDLVEKAVVDELAGATTWSGLVKNDHTITFPDGTGTLSTATPDDGDGKRLDVSVEVTKQVTGQALTLSNESPKVELSIKDGITVDLTATLDLSVVWTGEADNEVYLVADAAGPRLDVDVEAEVDAATAKAAIGILGVDLTGSTFALDAHLVARVNDPDGDGRLMFDAPGGGGSDGELAPDGSLDGLMTAGFDSPAGSLTGSFNLGAAATGGDGLDLPAAISATVGVSWPDISNPSGLSVTAPTLADTIGKFQNMSLRDLADGLAQVVTSLTAMQKAKFDANGPAAGDALIGDLDLPFMRGTVSDALAANAKLVAFLEEWVHQPADPEGEIPDDYDPAKVGQPKFASLQELIEELEDFSGIDLSGLAWDEETSKLVFTMTMTQQAPATPQDLDELSALASGPGATYSANGLALGDSPWQPGQWVGMRVVAGNSAGEIASNTGSSLTLAGNWIGGQPANTQPFVIVGADPHLGAVSFANTLDDGSGHGLVNANADQTFAKVSPSFTTTVTLVLDLQDPVTGDDCIGFEGNTQACPFTQGDGPFATRVASLPLNADRVMIRTGAPVVVADFPIETAVDFTANAGFFKVRVQGDLEVCNSSRMTPDADCAGTTSGHMLSIGLEAQGDADNDLRFRELFSALVQDGSADVSSLLDVDVNVGAYGELTVSVPDADAFLPGGASATFTASWNDLTQTSGPAGPQLDLSDLDEIFELDFDADNPQALFAIVVKTLQTLSQQLAQADPGAGGGIFDEEIPGLGRSLRDLMRSDQSNQGSTVSYGTDSLTDTSETFGAAHVGRAVVVGTQVGLVESVAGSTVTMTEPWDSEPTDGTAYMFRSPLDDAVDLMLANPPENIQDLVALLDERLGNESLDFRYLEVGGDPNLVLDLDWERSYKTSSPIRLELGQLNGADQTFAGAEASGNASVGVTGAIDVGLVVPLAPGTGPANATQLKVLEDSSIGIKANAEFTGTVKGVIGPLSIALGQPGGPAATQAQARANVSLDLAKGGAAANTPVSFGTFLTEVGAGFNAGNTPVECGEDLETDLMVCGRLPLFVNSTGSGDTWTPVDTISLRVPDSTDPDDLLDLDDTFSEGDPAAVYKELDIPADLAQKLLDAVLDFGNLGTGLDGYLLQIERAFRLAAFDGKLPLIGEDLQQGADFIGDLRSTIHGLFGNLPTEPSEVTDYLNDNIADALADAGMQALDVEVGFECTASLGTPPTPGITVSSDEPVAGKTWEYKVVAHQGTDSTGSAGDGVPSAAGSTPANQAPATLDADDYIRVAWNVDDIEGATGYKVLRKGPDDTEFKLLALVGADTTEYVDNGSATPTDYTPVAEAPLLDPCPAAAIDGVNLEFTVQQGAVSVAQGCTDAPAPGKPCFGADVPLDIGIPGLALKATGDSADNKIAVDLGFALHFKVGLSRQKGFFVSTKDGWGAGGKALPELQVGLGFDLPSTMAAELAFLQIDISKDEDAVSENRKLFAGAFQVDLRSEASEESCWDGAGPECAAVDTAVLTFADLGDTEIGDLFGVSLKGAFDIDWDIEAGVDSALPGVRTNFVLQWEFDNNEIDDLAAPTIEFNEVGINAGDFFQELLGPIVKEVKRVTGPITPVMDTLYAPIPVLSDLSKMAGGDDVTLVTLAKTFNTLAGGPSLEFVDTVKAIIDFINRLPTCGAGEDCYIPIGDFDVSGEDALETSATPAAGTGTSLIRNDTAISGALMKQKMNAENDNPAAAGKPVFKEGSAPKGDAEKSGFSFPILDNPASAFSLLMGDDVTLVEFDSGPLTLGFSWRQSFGPVYAPPPVMVTLSGSASVTLRFMAGLDTAGIRHAVEVASSGEELDGIKLLDGLFFKTVDDNGTPVPVVQLDGEIAAGAAVTALIITVGIEGGLHLTVGFYWNDPNDDGKFRVSEFLQAAIVNPLCLFTTSGRLSLFLRVYITLGFSPFEVSFDFTLADVTLLDFTAQPDCSPPPPRLGGTTGTTLVVFAGDFGKDSNRGAPWGNAAGDYEEDVVKVTALHFLQKPDDPQGEDSDFDGFAVDMLGEHREYPDPDLERVVVDGSSYDKPMLITFLGDGKKEGEVPLEGESNGDLSVFDKDAIVFGGAGDDVIQTGTGDSWVDGGGGHDQIVTADTRTSVAWIAGGNGNDKISTGHGDNKVAGDGSLGTATRDLVVTHNTEDKENHGADTQAVAGIVDWENLADPTTADAGTGDDTIGVGLGTNRVRGNGGADKIGVAADAPDGSDTAGNNVLVGDGGGDSITGGTGDDEIFTAAESEFGRDADGPADTATNVVDTGTGNDKVWGSTAEDHVSSYSRPNQQADLRGGGGDDALMGGYGTDSVYGGPGNDYVVAEPAKVGARTGVVDTIEGTSFGQTRPVEKLPLPAGTAPSTKTLVGGLGDDHILGGDGQALIFGDTLRDTTVVAAGADETCRAGVPVASDPVPEATTGAGGDGNDLILGGAGVDTVSAGGASDRVLTYGSADLLCGQEGTDVLFGGDADDALWGGSGNDRGYGEAGADLVFGNTGADTLYGQADADVMEGNDGTDWVSGGDADDRVYGGTRAEGRADVDDDLYGDNGEDVVIGDNGTEELPAVPYDLDGTPASAGGDDRVHGGAEDDTAYGGLGDDVLNGNAGDDHLEGNNDSDTVHGNDGEDHVVGGSFQESDTAGVGRPDTGDFLYGDAGPDLLTGDNAVLVLVAADDDTTEVTRNRGFGLRHAVTLLDLGAGPAPGTSGHDFVSGGDGQDVAYGQGGDDRVKGDADDDYAEGGPGTDWLEGNLDDDDLVGGSSTPGSGTGDATQGQPDASDAVFGGPGDDVGLGDNGQVLRPGVGTTPTRATVRLGSTAGVAMAPRLAEMWDRAAGSGYLGNPSLTRFGDDQLSGGEGVDVLWGQDGDDAVSGGAHDDYAEGNGGADTIRGDAALADPSDRGLQGPTLDDPDWPGTATAITERDGAVLPEGQDDLVGGTSTPGFRDDGDGVEGNGADDVALGDNGSLVRTLEGDPGSRTERVYTDRYPDSEVPATATRSRTHDPALPGPSTRFCTEGTGTEAACDLVGASGDDRLYGDDGDDGLWGQDGDDVLYGGAADDDLYGELGDDELYGESGQDAILGDRGGVVNEHLSEGDTPGAFTISLTQPPAETYTGFRRGLYDRRVDLLHDVDGDTWVGGPGDPAMPHDGLTEGGRDLIRGGPDPDNIHAGFGDDVANGDSGGDQVFGGDGEDVLWGGRGCDPVLDLGAADCFPGGTYDPAARGTDDRMVDHVFGGVGEPDAALQDINGADILDFNPRGTYEQGVGCTSQDWPQQIGGTTVDPCLWFEMTDKHDADLDNNNHHHGTDWIYGGWDRDVLQGDVTGNGPNPGDRLIDWNGAYNLYTHCNASYGGFNDLRLLAPDLHEFLTGLAWGSGAGRTPDDVLTGGRSAYRELAFTYTKDQKAHGVGKAYPGTPGHFDEVSCAD